MELADIQLGLTFNLVKEANREVEGLPMIRGRDNCSVVAPLASALL